MKYTECEKCVEFVGPINFWGNLGLTVFKLVFGLMCGSIALLADAVHSLGDVAIAIVMVLALRVSKKEADEDHQFGHGKIEFIGAGIIGFSMLLVAVLIVWYSLQAAVSGTHPAPDRIAILVAIVSILGNYLMYVHSKCAGEQATSAVMIANALENRADVLSSIAALIGIAGASMGWPLLDPIAAVAIGFLIFGSALKTLREAARGLGDFGLDPEITKAIRTAVEGIEGVVGVESIKTRQVGPEFEVGLRVRVPDTNTVDSSLELARKIKNIVHDVMEAKGRVNVGFVGMEERA
ncbi:cation diffusion facilitator family transporter [Candidatus Hydrogenedentota bacterium]